MNMRRKTFIVWNECWLHYPVITRFIFIYEMISVSMTTEIISEI